VGRPTARGRLDEPKTTRVARPQGRLVASTPGPQLSTSDGVLGRAHEVRPRSAQPSRVGALLEPRRKCCSSRIPKLSRCGAPLPLVVQCGSERENAQIVEKGNSSALGRRQHGRRQEAAWRRTASDSDYASACVVTRDVARSGTSPDRLRTDPVRRVGAFDDSTR
jgi:hypothetical protein